MEPIRCWPHLFSPRLLIIYLWSAAADQPRKETDEMRSHFSPVFSWNFPKRRKHFKPPKSWRPFQCKIKDSWGSHCWPSHWRCILPTHGREQEWETNSLSQGSHLTAAFCRCRAARLVGSGYSTRRRKKTTQPQKDHSVALGSVRVYSSLVCPHSFHILHILGSKLAGICRPPFSRCATDEHKRPNKRKTSGGRRLYALKMF